MRVKSSKLQVSAAPAVGRPKLAQVWPNTHASLSLLVVQLLAGVVTCWECSGWQHTGPGCLSPDSNITSQLSPQPGNRKLEVSRAVCREQRKPRMNMNMCTVDTVLAMSQTHAKTRPPAFSRQGSGKWQSLPSRFECEY